MKLFKAVKILGRSVAESSEFGASNLFGTESTQFESTMFIESQKEVDHELFYLLKELKLLKYYNNFRKEKCIFSDLEGLKDEDIKALFPEDKFAQDTFKEYIKKNYFQKDGWYIDKSMVVMDRSAPILARGSFGDIRLGRLRVGNSHIDVVIKETIISKLKCISKGDIINEVTVMAALKHESVLKTFGCYFSDDERVAHMVFQLCNVGDLRKYLKEHQDLPRVKKVKFLIQIAKAMVYIHSKGFIHRDLKPQNVLISDDENSVLICDFGLSKNKKNINRTMTGTPEYFAPELLFLKKKLEKPELTDIYSFGIMIWEVWNSKVAFEKLKEKFENNLFDLIIYIHKRDLRPKISDEMEADCHEDLINLMKWCWEKDLEQRCPSFNTVLEDLYLVYKDLKKANSLLAFSNQDAY